MEYTHVRIRNARSSSLAIVQNLAVWVQLGERGALLFSRDPDLAAIEMKLLEIEELLEP